MFEIGSNAMTLTQYNDIAYEAVSNERTIKHVQHVTQSGKRYNRSTGRQLVDYKVSFDRIEKAQYDEIAQYTSPYSIKNYYVRYTNTISEVVFEGFARIVMQKISINHDLQLYSFNLLIEIE
jgi:hypothetical protein